MVAYNCRALKHTCVVADYITGRKLRKCNSIPNRDKNLSVADSVQDRLWGSSSFVLRGPHGGALSPGIKRQRCEVYHLWRRLRMSGVILPVPHIPSWCYTVPLDVADDLHSNRTSWFFFLQGDGPKLKPENV